MYHRLLGHGGHKDDRLGHGLWPEVPRAWLGAEGGVRPARRERRHADVVGARFLDQGLGQAQQSPLCRAIDADLLQADLGGSGDDVGVMDTMNKAVWCLRRRLCLGRLLEARAGIVTSAKGYLPLDCVFSRTLS